MGDHTSIENRVRRLRRLRGLTQEGLGSLLGVSRQTINAIENGRYAPSLPLSFDIAKVFGTGIEHVFRPVTARGGRYNWRDTIITIPERLDCGLVSLRPHRPSDLPHFQRFLSDPDSTRFMAFTDAQKTPEGAAEMLDAVIASYSSSDPILSLTIAEAETDRYVGSVGAADAGNGSFEVYVTLLQEARGNGYAETAMRSLVRFLFDECGANELIADTVAENSASISLFERVGFTRLGPVHRTAQEGALAHREMDGIRYTLRRERSNGGDR